MINDFRFYNGLIRLYNDVYKYSNSYVDTYFETIPKDDIIDKMEEFVLEYKENDPRTYYIFERHYIDDVKISYIAKNELNRSYSRIREINMKMLRILNNKLRWHFRKQSDNVNNISGYGFSITLYKALIKGGYKTIESLSGIKYSDFIKISGAGEKSWLELIEFLQVNNIEYYDNENRDINKLKRAVNKCLDSSNKTINNQWFHTTEDGKRYNVVVQIINEK